MAESPEGERMISYDDHVAAVAEEQAQRGVVYRTGLALGRAEALQDAREAVAALPQRNSAYPERLVPRDDALAAIDNLKGEQA